MRPDGSPTNASVVGSRARALFGAALISALGALVVASPAGGAGARASRAPPASHLVTLAASLKGSDLTPRSLAVLYDQYNNAGATVVRSQNFEPAFDASDDEAADDFVVPAGLTAWIIDGVDVQGSYFTGPGPAVSFNVRFYRNGVGNLPGELVVDRLNQPFSYGGSTFAIAISSVVLDPGTYWVSVQANENYNPYGQWGWWNRAVGSNQGAAWRNPGGAGGIPACIAWGRRAGTCYQSASPDQVFRIRGTAACIGQLATIVGTEGNDTLTGTDGPDVIAGLGGNDQIDGRGAADIICGGAGDDRIVGGNEEFRADANEHDLLFGEAGNDTVDSGQGYLDLVSGGPGDDRLIGNQFAVLSYVFATAGVAVDLGRGTASGEGNDTLSGFPFVFGSPYSDVLIGDRSANFFFGLAGNDAIHGGDGFDVVAFNSKSTVRANLVTGRAAGGASEGDDTLAEIEGLGGGDGDDDLVGNRQDNFLYGGKGNDRILGGGGADSIFGKEGDDRLYGEAGNDLLEGGAGTNSLDGGQGENDRASYTWIPSGVAGQTGVTADLVARSAKATGNGGTLRDTPVIGVESLAGSPYPDTLAGNSKANALIGNAGRDTLYGRAGNDFLNGGPDVDTAQAGTGRDYCLDTELRRGCELTGRTEAQIASAVGSSALLSGRLTTWPELAGVTPFTESYTEPTCAPGRRGGGRTTIAPPKRVREPGGNDTVRWQAWLFRTGSRRAIASTPLAEGKLVSPANSDREHPAAWTRPNGSPINWPITKRLQRPGIYYWEQKITLVKLGGEKRSRIQAYYQPPGKASAVKSCDFRARR